MTIFKLKIVVRPKHVADNLNKILITYWDRVALDGNPWTWLQIYLSVEINPGSETTSGSASHEIPRIVWNLGFQPCAY
jgi:hypothetical protein